MRISKRALIPLLATAIGVSSMAFAGGAFGALGASRRKDFNHQGKRTCEPPRRCVA